MIFKYPSLIFSPECFARRREESPNFANELLKMREIFEASGVGDLSVKMITVVGCRVKFEQPPFR